MSEPEAKVFVRDDAYAWLPGSIVSVKDGQAFVRVELPNDWHSTTVLCQDSGLEEIENAIVVDQKGEKKSNAIRAISLSLYPNHELPLQNQCGDRNDLAHLPHIHEAAMLYNLKERNSQGKPYTRVRDIIISMNPFERNEELYSKHMQQQYAKRVLWDTVSGENEEEKKEDHMHSTHDDRHPLEPHVYEVCSRAYRNLAYAGEDQTILVTGESGAGKTETVKIALEYLAYIEHFQIGRADGGSHSKTKNGDLAQKIKCGSRVLEAFGNAATQRNNNSSRFGKHVQLQFTKKPGHNTEGTVPAAPPCSLTGSMCTTYLLEKSRVISHAIGETSFHIFYQLLSAPEGFRRELWPFLAACKAEDFAYLAHSGNSDKNSKNGDISWEELRQAMEVVSIQGTFLTTLMKAVLIVLQLGNIQFASEETINGNKTIISSSAEMNILSEMVGIDQKELEVAFTTRSVKTNFEQVRAQQEPTIAKEALDALAKEIYSRIFLSIVRQLNDTTQSSSEFELCGGIGLIDMYGFECLEVNQFEQLCINYADEQLQQKYVADNFGILKKEYQEEGIDIFDFSVVDNTDMLELLDSRRGILAVLQEQCMQPHGSVESFVSESKKCNERNGRFIIKEHFKTKAFAINHFAGPCTYDATNFIDLNMDRVSEELIACVSKSSNDLIRKELQYTSLNKDKADQFRKQKPTILKKFSADLQELMVKIERTKTRHIRCILPNITMSPRLTNHLMTLRQLESAGLMTAVALSRECFPDSMSYRKLLSRFSCLMKRADRQNIKQMALPDQIVYMLTHLFMSIFEEGDASSSSMPFACGRSKAYLRAGALEHLEFLRARFLSKHATIIQTAIRKIHSKRKEVQIRKMATIVQALWRGVTERRRFQRKLRQKTEKLIANNRKQAATSIQARWRMVRQACQYKRLRRAATSIQQTFRRYCVKEAEKLIDRGDLRNQAAGIIQAYWRVVTPARRLKQLRIAATTIQKTYRRQRCLGCHSEIESEAIESKLSTMIQKIKLHRGTLSSERPADQSLLGEVETLLIDLRQDRKETICRTQESAKITVGEPQVVGQSASSSPAAVNNIPEEIIIWERSEVQRQFYVPPAILNDLKAKVSSSKEKLVVLKSDNKALTRERDQWRQHASDVESAANKLRSAFERKVNLLEHQILEKEKENRDKIIMMKQTIEKQEKAFREEKEMLCKMQKEMEDKHQTEVDELRVNLLNSHETQEQLRTKASELQASHSTDMETMQTASDLTNNAKDAEIARLHQQVEELERNIQEAKELYQGMLTDAAQTHQTEIDTLKTELNQSQKSHRELKEELIELQTAHSEELQKRVTKTLDYDNKEAEIARLQKKLLEQQEASRYEKEDLSKFSKETEEKYQKEIAELKEEVFYAQESQRQLKSELSELQVVHAEELENVKQEVVANSRSESSAELAEIQDQLHHQEQIFRDEKEELCKMLREADEKHQTEVMELKEEIREAHEAYDQLESEYNKKKASYAEEFDRMMNEMLDSNEKDEEIAELKERLQQQEASHERDKEDLHLKLKEHLEDVRLLKEEFVDAQRLHRHHLHCILDSLEDMDADREANMTQLLEELDAMQRTKDLRIEELEGELDNEQIRRAHYRSELSTIEEDVESTGSEVNSVRQIIAEHVSERLKRSEEFHATLRNLQLAVKPENMRYIIEKIKKQHDSSAEMKVFAEIHRMSKVLGELYAMEEHSQEEADKCALAMLDRFLAASGDTTTTT